MPFEDTKIWKFNQHQKTDQSPFIYGYLECVIETIDGCKTKNSWKSIHNKIRWTYSIRFFTISNIVKNKHDVCKGKESMGKFCESSREHAMEIIKFKKKKMKLLTKE